MAFAWLAKLTNQNQAFQVSGFRLHSCALKPIFKSKNFPPASTDLQAKEIFHPRTNWLRQTFQSLPHQKLQINNNTSLCGMPHLNHKIFSKTAFSEFRFCAHLCLFKSFPSNAKYFPPAPSTRKFRKKKSFPFIFRTFSNHTADFLAIFKIKSHQYRRRLCFAINGLPRRTASRIINLFIVSRLRPSGARTVSSRFFPSAAPLPWKLGISAESANLCVCNPASRAFPFPSLHI